MKTFRWKKSFLIFISRKSRTNYIRDFPDCIKFWFFFVHFLLLQFCFVKTIKKFIIFIVGTHGMYNMMIHHLRVVALIIILLEIKFGSCMFWLIRKFELFCNIWGVSTTKFYMLAETPIDWQCVIRDSGPAWSLVYVVC